MQGDPPTSPRGSPWRRSTKTDLVFLLVFVAIASLDFLVSVIIPTIGAIGNEPVTVEVIEEWPNGTTRTYEEQETWTPKEEFDHRLAEYQRFLPLKHLGLFLIPTSSPWVLWLFAVASIPAVFVALDDVPRWRRIPYVYLLAASVAGFAASLWSTYGY